MPTTSPTDQPSPLARLTRSHAAIQAARFLRIAVFAFIAQLPTLGTAQLGWSTLAALAAAALETAFRQLYPAVPATLLTGLVDRLEAKATPSSNAPDPRTAAAAGQPPQPGGGAAT